MKFRNYIALSVILHIILFLLLLHLPEREKKESEPFFVSLEELPVPARSAPKVSSKPAARTTKKTLPKKKKKSAKKPLELKPKRTIPELENVLPEAIRGALKKTKIIEPEKKTIAQKDKGTPEKSEKEQEGSKVVQKKQQLPAVEKKTEPKKVELTKKETAQKRPLDKKVKSKPEPPKKKKIAQKPSVEKKGKYKPEPQKKNSLHSDLPVTDNKAGVTESQQSQKTDKSETSHQEKHIKLSQLFDKDTIKEAASKSTGSRKGASSKKGTDSVVTFDTTEFHLVGYMPRLRQRIESIWRYPPAAARRGLYGELYIRFTILKDGSLSNVELVRTSGHKSLDDAAVKALREGQPYWPLPKSWPQDNLTITGRFVYVPQGGSYLR